MKTNENQYVKSHNWMLVIGLLALVMLLVFAPSGRHGDESLVLRAKQQAEVLGLQLVQNYTQNKDSRAPASSESESEAGSEIAAFKGDGLIGLDPWGRPYRYNILATDRGIARVVITSDGPPKDPSSQSETNSEELSGKVQVVVSPSQ